MEPGAGAQTLGLAATGPCGRMEVGGWRVLGLLVVEKSLCGGKHADRQYPDLGLPILHLRLPVAARRPAP